MASSLRRILQQKFIMQQENHMRNNQQTNCEECKVLQNYIGEMLTFYTSVINRMHREYCDLKRTKKARVSRKLSSTEILARRKKFASMAASPLATSEKAGVANSETGNGSRSPKRRDSCSTDSLLCDSSALKLQNTKKAPPAALSLPIANPKATVNNAKTGTGKRKKSSLVEPAWLYEKSSEQALLERDRQIIDDNESMDNKFLENGNELKRATPVFRADSSFTSGLISQDSTFIKTILALDRKQQEYNAINDEKFINKANFAKKPIPNIIGDSRMTQKSKKQPVGHGSSTKNLISPNVTNGSSLFPTTISLASNPPSAPPSPFSYNLALSAAPDNHIQVGIGDPPLLDFQQRKFTYKQ